MITAISANWEIEQSFHFFGNRPPDVNALKDYVSTLKFNGLEMIFLRQKWQKLRTLWLFLYFLKEHKRAKSPCIFVIRERKHLLLAKLFRILTGTPIVSELHEGGFPLDRRPTTKRRFQKLLSTLDGLVLTNGAQVEFLLANGYRLPDAWIVLPNGVDTERFSLAQPKEESDRKTITYTGQFNLWKNIPLLFESLKHLPEHFTLRIAGGKTSQAESIAYIDQLTSQFDVKERVEYLGFVHPNELVERVIRGSSVLVLPLGENDIARYATSPMKLVEYMSTSLPIVAVGHPSVTSLTGRDTVHLTEADASHFAEAIKKATQEDSIEKKQRVERTNKIACQFDHKIRAQKFEGWLNQIIAQRTRKPGKPSP